MATVMNGQIQAVRVAPRRFTSSAPECSSCEKRVYAAEQVIGPGGRPYHKACLKCTDCKKTLDALHLLEHEGDPYCKQCHTKNFGIEGYGHGGATRANYTDRFSPSPYGSPASNKVGWSPRSNSTRDDGDRSRSISPEKVLSGENPMIDSPTRPRSQAGRNGDNGMDGDEWEPPSQTPPTASAFSAPERRPTPLTWSQSHPVGGGSPFAPYRPDSPVTSEATTTSSSTSGPPKLPGINALKGFEASAPDRCRRCRDVVYFAERILAAGHKWHKRCLQCGNCSKILDSHLVVSDDVPFCKKCYSEKKGIAEQGFVLRPSMY